MKQLAFVVLAVILTTIHSDFSYLDQANWQGSCKNNLYQSPIDIPCQQYVTSCPAAKGYQIYWQDPMIQFGGSHYEDLKTFFLGNSWVRFSNETNDYVFKSAQFHFHHPSEHTINGQNYPLEIHLVHVLDNPSITEYLVVGIFFEEDEHLAYDIFDAVKVESNTTFTHLFPFAFTNKAAYHYRGSLTTPPCTEAVNWFVQTEPIKIRPHNLERILAGREEANNRLTQRLGSRTVYLVGQGC